MTIFRRGRYLFWIGKELFDKYTKSLLSGVVIGIVAMVIFWVFLPTIKTIWFSPVSRIGVVGEFTPSSLPLFITQQLSSGLTAIDVDGSTIPALAQRWEATDSGKTYTFYLKNNIHWPTDEVVLSSDVNYSIRDVQFTPINDHTLVVTLKDPYSPFPTLVSKPILKRGLVGFGAYRISTIQLKGDTIQYIRLVTNKNTFSTVLEYRFYRTEAQAITAYKLGDIDKIHDLSQPVELSDWKHTSIQSKTQHNQTVAIFFNVQDPLLSERAVRQALGYALPETEHERAYSPISKLSWAYTDKIRKYTMDIPQSKKILSQADIDLSGKELILTTFPQYVEIAEKIVQSWNSLGLSAKVKIENTLPDSFQVLLTIHNLPPDPDQYPFWHSTQEKTNVTNYGNVKVDKILEDARRETDVSTRKKLYADFQKFLVEDAPAIFYFYPNRYTVERI